MTFFVDLFCVTIWSRYALKGVYGSIGDGYKTGCSEAGSLNLFFTFYIFLSDGFCFDWSSLN